MYQALYRKYRPATFDDVVGQTPIVTVLKNELISNRLSHAYLFCGTRGTGKTTCAKILAKAVNCPHAHDGNPCNECDICRGIDSGAILDVTEIDAASNNGVDNVRDIRDEVVYSPSATRYRVYIIDEVHMLSTGAFNALLKTLEEPPAHVIFILATTEFHKIPATILSRCQRFDFKRITNDVIAARLADVCAREGITADADALALVARLADGSMRDALSILDQCAVTADTVTYAHVAALSGVGGRRYLGELVAAVARQDYPAAVSGLSAVHADGKDMGVVCEEIISYFRDMMLLKTVEKPDALLACPPDELEALRGLTGEFTLPMLIRNLRELQRTYDSLTRSANKKLELELCLLRLCDSRVTSDNETLLARVCALEKALASGAVPPAVQLPQMAQAVPAPSPAVPAQTAPADDEPPFPLADRPAAPADAPAAAEPTPTPAAAAGGELFFWTDVMKSLSKSISGMLQNAAVASDGRTLTLTVRDKFVYTLLSKDSAKGEITRSVAQYAGAPLALKILFEEQNAPPAESENENLAALIRRGRENGTIQFTK